jgi:hypothetical protein
MFELIKHLLSKTQNMLSECQPRPLGTTSKAVEISALMVDVDSIEVAGIIFMGFATEGTIL